MTENNDVSVFENFLALHESQLRASGVPSRFFKSLSTKLTNKVFDAGDFLQLLLLDYGEEDRGEKDPIFTVVASTDIKADDPNAIFLIDHALTYRTDILRKQLSDNPALLNRLSIMMGLPVNDDIEQVMKNVWRFCNFYSINAQGKILIVLQQILFKYNLFIQQVLPWKILCHCSTSWMRLDPLSFTMMNQTSELFPLSTSMNKSLTVCCFPFKTSTKAIK